MSPRAPCAPEPALRSRAPSRGAASGAGAERGIRFFLFLPQIHLSAILGGGPAILVLWLCAFLVPPLNAQVESVQSTAASHYFWVSNGRVEGHLALNHSPSGAFSPDSSTLAVEHGDKLVLMELENGALRKVLHPHLEDVSDLDIESADFLTATRLFLLGMGLIREKGSKGVPPRTPLLGFQWYIDQDSLFEKLNAIGGHPGIGPIFYFPQIKHLGIYTSKQFEFWNPESHRGGDISIPELLPQRIEGLGRLLHGCTARNLLLEGISKPCGMGRGQLAGCQKVFHCQRFLAGFRTSREIRVPARH